MNVRQKITLLITSAGVLSSLVFSCFILGEMLERPYYLQGIDADLAVVANRAVQFVIHTTNRPLKIPSSVINPDKYWLAIYDQTRQQQMYQSSLTSVVKNSTGDQEFSLPQGFFTFHRPINTDRDPSRPISLRIKTFTITEGNDSFVVTAGYPVEQLDKELWDIVVEVAGGLFFSILILLAISYFVAGLILKPIRVLNEQVRDISEKQLDQRMVVASHHDEFNALAITLNQVFDRLEHAFYRQKRLLADTSHELKTPLTMMRLALDEIHTCMSETQIDPHEENHLLLMEQVLRMERLVKGLLDLTALEMAATTAKETMNISEMIDVLVSDYQIMAYSLDITLSNSLPQDIEIQGDLPKLTRAFSNLLDNAIKYNIIGGQIKINGAVQENGLNIVISNTGPGIARDELPKIFEQFYRVEQSRSILHGGSGLGLAIVKRIIEQHGGTIRIDSQPDQETRVVVDLPS